MASSAWSPAGEKQNRSGEWLSYLYGYGKKEPSTRDKFVAVSKDNLAVVNQLLDHAKRLNKSRRYADAEALADLAEKLLESNANLLNVVGDVLDKK